MKSFFTKRKSRSGSNVGSNISLHSSEGSINCIGSVPYTVNVKQLTPFLKSVWKNEIDKFRKKMKKNYNQVDKEKRSALHLAAAKGHIMIIKDLLINFKLDLIELKDNCNKTAVHKSVEQGDVECVTFFIESGAKIDVKDFKGNTLIHAAVKYKHTNVLKYLLEKSLSPDVENMNGSLPIHGCAKRNYTEGLKLLLRYSKACVNNKNKKGITALIYAVQNGHTECLKLLLEVNADTSIVDNQGRTAAYYAEFYDYKECQSLLNAHQQEENVEEEEEVVDEPQNSVKDLSPSSQKPNHQLKTLTMPDFVDNLDYEEKTVERNSKLKSLPQNMDSTDNGEIESIKSFNSWNDNFSASISEATIPEINPPNRFHDISTPSSMPNPSIKNHQSPSKVAPSNIINHKSNHKPNHDDDDDDVESFWSNSETNDPPIKHQTRVIRENEVVETMVLEQAIDLSKKPSSVDSDWDSDTSVIHTAKGDLSIIDEESANKHIPTASDTSVIPSYGTRNVISTNPPVRCDSNDMLDDDSENDTFNDLQQTAIPNYHLSPGNETSVAVSKPPKSPMNYSSSESIIPSINVEVYKPLVQKRSKGSAANGDNLSYTSTEVESRHNSLADSESINGSVVAGGDRRSVQDYINKCAQLESKLRMAESERDNLVQQLDNLKIARDKADGERLKLQQDYRKLNEVNSEKQDDFSELKSKFKEAEEQLKKRENDLSELRLSKQTLDDKYNDLERKSILNSSKMKQMQEEIDNLQTELKIRSSDKSENEQAKSVYEAEKIKLMEKNQALQYQVTSIENDLESEKQRSEMSINQFKSQIDYLTQQVDKLDKTVKADEEEKENMTSEIKQLKETIKRLNLDLESSNKSVTIVTKKEKENKELLDQIETQKVKINEMSQNKRDLESRLKDSDMEMKKLKDKLDEYENSLHRLESNLSQVEMENNRYCAQVKEFEKLVDTRDWEIKEKEEKVNEIEMELTRYTQKTDNVLDRINEKIDNGMLKFQDQPEIVEHFEQMRKSTSNYGANISFNGDRKYSDTSLELTKARSQISALQMELDKLKTRYTDSIDQSYSTKLSSPPMQSNSSIDTRISYLYNMLMIEKQHVDKLESLEKENQKAVGHQTRQLNNKTQECHRLDSMNHQLSSNFKEERKKHLVMCDKEKSLSNQLRNEIKRVRQFKDIIDAVKSNLDRCNRDLNYPLKNNESMRDGDDQDDEDVMFNTIPRYCARLLEYLKSRNEDLRLKIKRIEYNTKISGNPDRRASCHNISTNNLEFAASQDDKNIHDLTNQSQIVLKQQMQDFTQTLEHQRQNREKLDKIRDENELQLRTELYQLRQQNMLEVNELLDRLALAEREKLNLSNEVGELRDQLQKERRLKDTLTEQVLGLVNNGRYNNGSVLLGSQYGGSHAQLYNHAPVSQHSNPYNYSTSHANVMENGLQTDVGEPKIDALHHSQYQYSTPPSNLHNHSKPMTQSASMLNLAPVPKSLGPEDDELRNRLRQELDRSIARHLSNGRPINQLKIRDKIRSLNVARYPISSPAWNVTS